MNVNLESLLATAESTITQSRLNRQQISRISGKKCPQCEDGLIHDIKSRLCRVCGDELIDIIEVAEPGRSSTDSTNLFDFLGADLRAAILESLAQSEPDRQISAEYLSTLGKVILDQRRGLLYDIVFQFEMLSIMGTVATFGSIPAKEISSTILFGDPEFGEGGILRNSSLCNGSMVLLKRGKVSFASKAMAAQSSGAIALIVCQTFEVWPFVMADSANELLGIDLIIPVIMISQSDSLILEKLLLHRQNKTQLKEEKENNSSNETPSRSLSCKLLCGRFEEECSICQENMLVGNTVLKLACRHAYHAECVQTWLERHNTCPLCRNEMPKSIGPRKKPAGVNDMPVEMPYFN